MPKILTSWKEIGQYFGKGVRTVQRWEREAELPVRREAGPASHSVIAMVEELEAWARGRPRRPSHAHAAALEREIANLQTENVALRSRLDAVEGALLAMIGARIATARDGGEIRKDIGKESFQVRLTAQQSRAEAVRARLAFAEALCALSETRTRDGGRAELWRAQQAALRIRKSLEQPGFVPLHELDALRDLHRKLAQRIESVPRTPGRAPDASRVRHRSPADSQQISDPWLKGEKQKRST
ncbi:MAG TPA: hypothetical protein VME68_15240 [Acidobacteriaceae bacterium]|nr:hypothetical protein [Acidobacteriaceae bacterium]